MPALPEVLLLDALNVPSRAHWINSTQNLEQDTYNGVPILYNPRRLRFHSANRNLSAQETHKASRTGQPPKLQFLPE